LNVQQNNNFNFFSAKSKKLLIIKVKTNIKDKDIKNLFTAQRNKRLAKKYLTLLQGVL
jgi:hypothetical protein